MFQKFEVQGIQKLHNKQLHEYVNKKIGGLDKYLSPHARLSAHADVHLSETKLRGEKHSICEVKLNLPSQVIVVKESGINMYSAVDITEAKLKQQLQKYKERHASWKLHRRLFNRIRNS